MIVLPSKVSYIDKDTGEIAVYNKYRQLKRSKPVKLQEFS